jgi:hydrogenase nickel incorporation protein HypA/HybF
MHELSIAEAMVAQLEGILAKEPGGFTRIERIRLERGALCGVEREPFEFAFPVVAQGTVAQGASLEFVEVPLRVSCRACGARTEPDYPLVRCAACGGGDVEVLSGRDFRILSMEVS